MICLTTENKVYSWGSGENGILGHGNTYGLNKPQMIKEFLSEEIIFVAAGSFNSAAINVNGHLYSWGRGKYGLLGHGSEEDITSPKRIKEGNIDKEQVFFISLGFYHTICITSNA
jgi:E3 ubiquitin-protein ligase HERC2